MQLGDLTDKLALVKADLFESSEVISSLQDTVTELTNAKEETVNLMSSQSQKLTDLEQAKEQSLQGKNVEVARL